MAAISTNPIIVESLTKPSVGETLYRLILDENSPPIPSTQPPPALAVFVPKTVLHRRYYKTLKPV
jgi:hypothetical protein